MFKQIITTISSFNSVTAATPTIKTQPQFEENAKEVKDGDKVIINEGTAIIKFQSAKAEEYANLTDADVKLKSFVIKKEEDANDPKKNPPKDIDVKDFLKVYKEGDDTSVVLNLYNFVSFPKQDEKDIFNSILKPKVASITAELTNLQAFFVSVVPVELTEDNPINEKLIKILDDLQAITDKEKVNLSIASIEAFVKSIQTMKVTVKENFNKDTFLTEIKRIISLPLNQKQALDAAIAAAESTKKSSNPQSAFDACVVPIKDYVKKEVEKMLKELKDTQTTFVQTLKGVELYKTLSDTKLAFGFAVTYKESKDAKKTIVLWTNFFNIVEKKLVYIPKGQIHFSASSEQSGSNDNNPFYKKWWFIVIIVGVILLVIGVIVYFVFSKDDSDTDE